MEKNRQMKNNHRYFCNYCNDWFFKCLKKYVRKHHCYDSMGPFFVRICGIDIWYLELLLWKTILYKAYTLSEHHYLQIERDGLWVSIFPVSLYKSFQTINGTVDVKENVSNTYNDVCYEIYITCPYFEEPY